MTMSSNDFSHDPRNHDDDDAVIVWIFVVGMSTLIGIAVVSHMVSSSSSSSVLTAIQTIESSSSSSSSSSFVHSKSQDAPVPVVTDQSKTSLDASDTTSITNSNNNNHQQKSSIKPKHSNETETAQSIQSRRLTADTIVATTDATSIDAKSNVTSPIHPNSKTAKEITNKIKQCEIGSIPSIAIRD